MIDNQLYIRYFFAFLLEPELSAATSQSIMFKYHQI